MVNGIVWSCRVLRHAVRQPLACVNAHSLSVLPVAAILAQFSGARLVYQPHELETETTESRGLRRLLARLTERLLIGLADAHIVVSEPIAEWYIRRYSIRKPAVVRNIPKSDGFSAVSSGTTLRQDIGIPSDHVAFICQGLLSEGRRIRQLIRVFGNASPQRHLIFMGMGTLEPIVKAAVDAHPNIHLVPPVAPAEVLARTAGADVGIVGVENICLSYYYSLPNKFFEYILAGLPVIVPPYPGMARIVRSYNCGWIAGESDADWIDLINSLDASRIAAARGMMCVPKHELNWKSEEQVLKQVYCSLFAPGETERLQTHGDRPI